VNLGESGQYVYVVDKNNVAQMRPVKVLNDDGKFDAIQGNVKAGDRVITDGQLRVVPGKPVKVQDRRSRKAK
jgi:multidrug efflux pump subunit AcrA (membrane-fusion protein)